MINHIVWWTLKKEAEGNSAAQNGIKIKEMLEDLEGQFEYLKSIEVSLEVGESSTVDAHIVLRTTHGDMEGLTEYANHPKHLEIVEFIKKVVSSRQAIDYSL